jgi:hypothetical protein
MDRSRHLNGRPEMEAPPSETPDTHGYSVLPAATATAAGDWVKLKISATATRYLVCVKTTATIQGIEPGGQAREMFTSTIPTEQLPFWLDVPPDCLLRARMPAGVQAEGAVTLSEVLPWPVVDN